MRAPEDELEELRGRDLYREISNVITSAQGSRVEVDGRELVNFSSNDYLGLAGSGYLKGIFVEAVGRYGVGSGASRLVCGPQLPHRELEEAVAAYLGKARSLVFATGFAATAGVLGAVVGKGDVVILDKLCHASLVDGARASGATMRVFPHGKLEKLESHLRWADGKVGAEGRILVVTEAVFSMDGDRAPLAEIVELKDRFGAWLLLDEAHAFGIMGPGGRGLAYDLGVAEGVDLHMGTLGKAAGVAGGFVATSGATADLLVNRARSFIYSTAPPAAQAAAAAAAEGQLASAEGDARRGRLWANIAQLAPDSESAIVPWRLGDAAAALQMAAELRELGYLIPAIRFPTVPRGEARLRLTLSAAHQIGEVRELARVLRSLCGS